MCGGLVRGVGSLPLKAVPPGFALDLAAEVVACLNRELFFAKQLKGLLPLPNTIQNILVCVYDFLFFFCMSLCVFMFVWVF